MNAFLNRFGLRLWVTVFSYVGILATSFWLAYELRFDFSPPPEFSDERLRLLPYAVAVKFLGLVLLRQTGSVLRYFGIPDLVRVTVAMTLSSAMLIAPRFLNQVDYVFPRGVLLIDLLLSVVGLCMFRIVLRVYQERVTQARRGPSRPMEQIVIVGAGDTGASLANDLLNMPARGFKPVAFADDDPAKKGQLIHGVSVIGKPEDLLRTELDGVTTVIIAMPSAPQKRVREVMLMLAQHGYRVEIVPALEDLASGRAKVSRIRAVEVADLLGREPIQLDTAAIRQFLENKVVMVTGAGGSIGSELCRQVAGFNPKRLLMLDQSEGGLFQIEQEMAERGLGALATPLVADILDGDRMRGIFERLRPQVVFHAAAHKHVFLMERQPGEAVRNNSFGTRILGEIADQFGVEAFVLISTDKAINPTNVMGASKRLAEIHLQAIHARGAKAHPAIHSTAVTAQLAQRQGESESAVGDAGSRTCADPAESTETKPTPPRTKFVAVRFGNVLGSSGSVVPIFKRQIAAGGPVTVTHPEVTRYFMTIPEAVCLVMQAGVLGAGGEIFVLNMGQPVKIINLARQMIELSGFKVGEDIEIKLTGLKPGEKLYEELQHHDESHLPTEHPQIMRFVPQGNAEAASARAIDQLEPVLSTASPNAIKQQLKMIVPEYTPHLE